MSERTYKLLNGKELILDGDGLWMRHPELGIETMRVESVLGDLLALVDSLQQALEQTQYHLHREQYMSAESVVDAALGE
ncbi:hypothetical protein ACU1JV_26750 [Paenibacillus sp. T2-29]